MIAFDTSFLVDYLDGVEAAASYLEEHSDRPFFAPSLVLFEVYRGAARTGGREQIERVASSLDWVDPLPLTDAGVQEAAVIEAELLETGERVNLGDTLIAGVVREAGGSLVTADSHFGRVTGLDVVNYRRG